MNNNNILFSKISSDAVLLIQVLTSSEKTVGELGKILLWRQPKVSSLLSVLRRHDLVRVRADGLRRYYSLNLRQLERYASDLRNIADILSPPLGIQVRRHT